VELTEADKDRLTELDSLTGSSSSIRHVFLIVFSILIHFLLTACIAHVFSRNNIH
jgi:hypothetical protein